MKARLGMSACNASCKRRCPYRSLAVCESFYKACSVVCDLQNERWTAAVILHAFIILSFKSTAILQQLRWTQYRSMLTVLPMCQTGQPGSFTLALILSCKQLHQTYQELVQRWSYDQGERWEVFERIQLNVYLMLSTEIEKNVMTSCDDSRI